jgi:hypothetical protein
MQNCKKLRISQNYFPMGKSGGPGPQPVDRVHGGCTMDREWARGRGSPERN